MLIGARNGILMRGGSPTPPSVYWGLTFTAREANSTLTTINNGTGVTADLEYSYDAENWNNFDYKNQPVIVLSNIGDKVYFRAGAGGNSKITTNQSSTNTSYWCFSIPTGSMFCSGDIMSLFTRNEEDAQSVTMGEYAITRLFSDCNGLYSAPTFSALNLSSYCYAYCFYNCANLQTAPALPASTAIRACYQRMFSDCTSLEEAPEIMLDSLAIACMSGMFQGDENLSRIKVHFDTWGAALSTANWLKDVSSSGTFTCPYALDTTTRGVGKVPVDWTVETF